MSFCKILFSYFERILFNGLDDEEEEHSKIKNRYPFSEKNSKNEINYDCSESDSSESDSDNYHYIIPANGYKITSRNIAFC